MSEPERILMSGFLSNDTAFSLVVTGNVGVTEISRLIEKLIIDKQILIEEEVAKTAAPAARTPEDK